MHYRRVPKGLFFFFLYLNFLVFSGCGKEQDEKATNSSSNVTIDQINSARPVPPLEQLSQVEPSPAPGSKVLGTPSRFEKLLAVLGEFGIDDESSYRHLVREFSELTTRREFEARLKYIDPQNELTRYAIWDDHQLSLYRDRDSKRIKDFSIRFAPEDHSRELRTVNDLTTKIAALRENSVDLPLKGLRVAIDAGHMHSGEWDSITGKYVKMNDKFVSEGFITFATAQAFSRELRNLGAETLLIRDSADAVTKESFSEFDLTPYAHAELLAATDRAWFDSILSIFDIGADLFSAFENSEDRKRIYSESRRVSVFTHRVDLAARIERALEFKPDITVIIHYDAWSWGQNPPDFNESRTYIMGNVMPGEAASREDRALILRELLNPVRWDLSLDMSKHMVQSLSKRVDVPVKNSPTDFGSIRVEDGVYARNLGLTRRIYHGLLTYFECMMYENPKEFEMMSTHDSRYGDYPARVDAVAEGLTRGVLNFVGHQSVVYGEIPESTPLPSPTVAPAPEQPEATPEAAPIL
ncbi:MAG TPA: hypothetical protein PLH57_02290 [Oligoflexia bacterium]|nr:hypothetical protein [Oligoflexia bacterium]